MGTSSQLAAGWELVPTPAGSWLADGPSSITLTSRLVGGGTRALIDDVEEFEAEESDACRCVYLGRPHPRSTGTAAVIVKCDVRVPPGTMCASLCGKGLLYEDKLGSWDAWRREELAGVAHSGDLAVI